MNHHFSLLRTLSIAAARLQGTGLPRLSERLRRYYQHNWPGGEIAIDDFRGDLRIAVDLRDLMGSRIFWFDYYSGAELKLLSQLLSPNDVFLDVGANIGEFTLPAARQVGPRGRVISFEPIPRICAKLERHVQWNGLGNVTIIPQAIGDREGMIPMFGPPVDAQELHEGLPTAFASSERPAKIADVSQTTLDRIVENLCLDNVSGIKLDIEGAELPALRGGSETLRRFKPWLLCEIGANTCQAAGYSPWEVIELLHSCDYRVNAIHEDGLHPIKSSDDLQPWQNVLAQSASRQPDEP